MKRSLWFNWFSLLALAAILLTACSTPSPTVEPLPTEEESATLHALYMNQAGYSEEILQEMAQQFHADNPGVEINFTFVKYDELHDKIVTSAAASTATYDVILLDLIWTAEFGHKGYVIPLDERITEEQKADIAPAIFDAFIYNDQMWAFPFLANFQNMFYNLDHLQAAGFDGPPATLEEWYAQMVALKEQDIVQYPYIDSWNQKEGLVCDYVRTAAQFGGNLFDENGQPIMDQGAGLRALQFMRRLVDEELADPAALTTDEPGAMNALISGAATFNTNWTFVRGNMLDPEKSNIVDAARTGLLPTAKDVAAPAGTVSGFQGLAVMANSDKQEVAWRWIQFATSAEVQQQHLESEFPIWSSLQNSEQEQEINPDAEFYATNLANAHHRPKVANYPEVSAIIQEEVHSCLLQITSPEEATAEMVQRIDALEE
ncbi:MAG: extracellular solute-binding protein [Chloroflexota bacterium]|nr:extracellular solute-binding protein [Chloroflexota bacterium]